MRSHLRQPVDRSSQGRNPYASTKIVDRADNTQSNSWSVRSQTLSSACVYTGLAQAFFLGRDAGRIGSPVSRLAIHSPNGARGAHRGAPGHGERRKELVTGDALRKVRYHAVDANGECVLDVTGTVRRVDKHEQIRSVEFINETSRGRVVPQTDVGGSIFHRASNGSLGQPAEEQHERGLWVDRPNMCQLVVQEGGIDDRVFESSLAHRINCLLSRASILVVGSS